MKTAVILVNYNGFSDTGEAIVSLLKQQTPIEIIVVDNASENDEAARLKSRFSEITVISSESNLGFAKGNNLGIRYALENHADYIMLLNNDTVIDPQMIDALLHRAAKDIITVPAMYYYDFPERLWYGGGFFNRWTGNVHHANLKEETFVDFATGCCIFAAASVFERVGMLNEDYFMYCEDAEFSIRLKQLNYRILYVPDARLRHKVGRSSGGEQSALSIYYTTKNRIKLIRSQPRFFRGTALPFTVVSRLIRCVQFTLKGNRNSVMFLKGIRDGLQERKIGTENSAP